MRWGLWLGLWLSGLTLAHADYQAAFQDRIDAGELTGELKRAVPAVEGCDEDRAARRVTCRRLTGTFTDAERQAMNAALAAHGPEIRQQRHAQRRQRRASARAKLEALGLTTQELDAVGLSE